MSTRTLTVLMKIVEFKIRVQFGIKRFLDSSKCQTFKDDLLVDLIRAKQELNFYQ